MKRKNCEIKLTKETYYKSFVAILIIIISIITFGFLILYLKQSSNANSSQEDSVNKSVEEQTVKFTPSNEFEKYLMNPETIPSLTNQGDLNSVVSNLKDVQKFMLAMLQFNDDKEQSIEYFSQYLAALRQFAIYNEKNILNEKFTACQNMSSSSQAEECAKEYEKLIAKAGLKVSFNFTYGNHLVEDKEFTYKIFAKYLPDDWQEFLRIRALHAKPALFDSYVNVSYDELNSRAYDYETFMHKYPKFKEIETVENYLYEAMFSYIYDKGKFEISSDENNSMQEVKVLLKPEYINSVQTFINQNPNSNLIPVFKEMLVNNYIEAYEKYPYKKFERFVEEDDLVPEYISLTFEFKEVYDWYIYSKTTGLWKIQKGYEPLNADEIVIFQTPHEGSQHYSRLEILNNNKTFIKNISFCEDNSMDDICLSSPAVYLTLLNSKLYLFSPATLMLSEIKYNNNNGFNIVKLNLHQIQAIFPKAEIIKMSEFKNNEHTIYLSLQPKQYLFINDTENIPYNYLQYSFSSNTDVLFSQIMPNLFQPNKAVTIIYSRNGENSCTTDNPCYYIHIKNMLDKFKHNM